MEKKVDWNYSRILQAILSISWKQHLRYKTCTATYHPSEKNTRVRKKKMCAILLEKQGRTHSDWILWTPTHTLVCVRQPSRTYLYQLCADTGCSLKDLRVAMDDKDQWREREREINDICVVSAIWWWWFRYNCIQQKKILRNNNTNINIKAY